MAGAGAALHWNRTQRGPARKQLSAKRKSSGVRVASIV